MNTKNKKFILWLKRQLGILNGESKLDCKDGNIKLSNIDFNINGIGR